MSVKSASGFNEEQLLQFAASLERASKHALAAAIVGGAEARTLKLSSAEGFESVTGKGVKARIDGALVSLGNRKLMDDAGVAVESLSEAAEELRADGQTVMFGTVDGKIAGLIGVADPIKPTTEKLSANCARRIFASSC